MSTAVAIESKAWYLNRWNQLILGVIAMMAISSPQYVWTLFTGPLNQKLGTTLAELQWTVSLLVILLTWSIASARACSSRLALSCQAAAGSFPPRSTIFGRSTLPTA